MSTDKLNVKIANELKCSDFSGKPTGGKSFYRLALITIMKARFVLFSFYPVQYSRDSRVIIVRCDEMKYY